MVIEILTKGLKIGRLARQNIRRTLNRSLLKFSTKFSKAYVSFKDINGPKGGMDTECLIRVDLIGRAPVIVKTIDSNSSAAFARCKKKLHHSLRKNSRKRLSMQRLMNFQSAEI